MAQASDDEIIAAAHALRDARLASNAAFDGWVKARAEERAASVQHGQMEELVRTAVRELDRLLEMRDRPYV